MNQNKPIIAERIKNLRKEKGLTQEQLAQILGLNAKSSIANYESGANSPSDDIKNKMCEIFNCTMDYLIGKSHFKFFSDNDIQKLINNYKHENAPDIKYEELTSKDKNILNDMISNFVTIKDEKQPSYPMEYYRKQLLDQSHWNTVLGIYLLFIQYTHDVFEEINEVFGENNNENLKTKKIQKQLQDVENIFYMCPVYKQISAGQPNWEEENIEGRIPIDTNLMDIVNPEEYFFLCVNDESMNKVIKNGAFALIHKQDTIENGEIAVVLVDGFDATIKKFTKKRDLIILEPQSKDESFEMQVYDKDISIKILGKYVGKMEINK